MGFVAKFKAQMESIFCCLIAMVILIPIGFSSDTRSRLFFIVRVLEKVGMLSYFARFPFLKLSERFLTALIATELLSVLPVDGVTCFSKPPYRYSGPDSRI